MAGSPPEALCGGISKANFQETLSSFGDKCPQNGSKNGHGMPPHRAFCGSDRLEHRSGSGFRLQGSGFRVQGSGFRVRLGRLGRFESLIYHTIQGLHVSVIKRKLMMMMMMVRGFKSQPACYSTLPKPATPSNTLAWRGRYERRRKPYTLNAYRGTSLIRNTPLMRNTAVSYERGTPVHCEGRGRPAAVSSQKYAAVPMRARI